MGTKAYFFAGGLYARYNKLADLVDAGYPLPIAGNWTGMEDIGFSSGITAAIDLLGGASRIP